MDIANRTLAEKVSGSRYPRKASTKAKEANYMTKRNRTSKTPVTVLEVSDPIETETVLEVSVEDEIEVVAEVSDPIESFNPLDFFPSPSATPPSTPRFVVSGKRDSLGYGTETETSFLATAIRTGSYTKASLLTAFLTRYVPDNSDAETKRKKISFSVFFSDAKRPIGTYHASRSLGIRIDPNTGIVSVPESDYLRAEKAIADNVLVALKGLSPKKTPEKFASVLKAFGLPL